jgi:glycerophosphoryl diester phosphodiesterase
MKRKPLIIAHRAACGYLPEQTLEGTALAFAMGADCVEFDSLLTRDNHAIVFHDHYLDAMTDVAGLFHGRARADGRHYAVDFTLDEIRQLSLGARIDLATGKKVYPDRFPDSPSLRFRIPTLEEELALIRGLNASMGRSVGVYLEPKGPAYHRREGKAVEDVVLDVFRKFGYTTRDSGCYIQSFEPDSIRYMRDTLKCDLTMVQLLGDSSWEETPGVDYAALMTPEGLDGIARYADLVGVWTNHLAVDGGKGRPPRITKLTEWAHERGMQIIPYTLRADALPSYANTFDDLLELFLVTIGVDGIFTDFPDLAKDFAVRRGLA